MTSKHFKWQARWRLDLAAGTADHDTGFQARLVQTARGPGAEALNAEATIQALATKHGGHNAPLMIERMLREVRQLHAEAMEMRRGAFTPPLAPIEDYPR